jgi:hypothetical protein
MAYTTRTATTLSHLDAFEYDAASGTAPGTGSGNGIQFINNGRIIAIVSNTNGSGLTVTMVIGKTINGVTPTAPTCTVAATTGVSVLGPFPPGTWNDSSGYMKLDFSATTGAKCVLVECPTTA